MELTLFELFNLGGWAMWPLVVFSVATLALFVERAVVLMRADLNTERLRGRPPAVGTTGRSRRGYCRV